VSPLVTRPSTHQPMPPPSDPSHALTHPRRHLSAPIPPPINHGHTHPSFQKPPLQMTAMNGA
jgi:hypothetical protein